MDPKLVKPKREIGSIAGQIHGNAGAVEAFAAARAAIVKLRRQAAIILRAATIVVKTRTSGIPKLSRKALGIAVHSAKPIRKTHTPSAAVSVLSQPGRRTNRGRLSSLLLAACFGLVAIWGIVLLALFLQIQQMHSEIAQSQSALSDARAQLNQLESTVRMMQERAQQSATHPNVRPQPALLLTKDEKATVRQFIRVLPPAPGGQPKIHVGDAISGAASAPVPDVLADQLPKLQGARFLIDQDGAIVILGEGSSRADTIISPR